LIKPVLEARLLFVSNNFSVMNFSQKSDYWAGFKEEFEFFNSILYRQQMQQPKSDNMAQMYNYAIQTKGLLLNSDAKLRRKVLTSGDSSLSATYNEWLYQKEYYALVATFSKQQLMEDKISPEEIGLYIEDLEKQINVKTGNLLTFSKVFDWKDVKNALPEKSTSVEMVRFRYFNQNFTDTVIYACLSISKEDANGPNAIFSTDGKLMESSYLKYYRNASINKLEDENSYTNYWKPFVANVPSGNTIFFSSEGVYNQINPEMLYDETVKKYALEANTFVFVSSTKDLVAETEKKKVEKSLESVYYLFGNPKFYDQKLIGRKDTVANLPGAAKEIEDISAVLTKNARKNIKLLGSNVTEDTLKAIQNPSVIHIATHGFFMEQNYDESATQNPMLNSGLMLSGSGNILATLESTYINQKPGILTASEVMELNFSNTNLVVLSACETGRGQVEVGEGVYGLQRAFLVAGAKAIILSLFKVDDEATRLLMSKFYEKSIQNGGDYRKAFREAKQALRDSPEFEKPVFWGSFIMIEGKPAKNNGTRKSNQGI
ncbi:MAG: CHAT domain-containing protein, partial [Cytophagales bacterium]